MFFQEGPPDTSGYMIAGYVIFFVISAIYLLSLAIRRSNLERDLEVLESMRAESRRSGRSAGVSPSKEGSARRAPTRRRQVRKKVTRK